MVDFKVVLSTADGKSYQKELKSPEADHILQKTLGEKVSGESLGFSGYEFLITGASDKSGFPLRKGIQAPRKQVFVGKSVGCSGKDRHGGKQRGLLVKKTVSGETINAQTVQVNLKVLKEGAAKLAPAESGEAAKV